MTADHIVAGTGPRALEQANPATRTRAATAIQDAVAGLARTHGKRLVIMSGMARGFDHLLARTAVDAGVRLWCAIPTRSYGGWYWRDWPAEFECLLAAAWRTTYVMEDVHGASGLYLDGLHANFVRNYWMVEQATEFLVWEPSSRGAAHCLAVVQIAGKPYRVLSDHQPAIIPEAP